MERTYEPQPETATGKVCFAVGRLDATAAAVKAMMAHQIDPYKLLRRHERGDYGVLSAGQKEENAEALRSGGRILSVHALEGDALWIITERGRRTTNLVLQSEILECQEHEYE
jgi:hypothetical protein